MKLTVAGCCIIIQGCQYFNPPWVAEPNTQLCCCVLVRVFKILHLAKHWCNCPRKNEGKIFGNKRKAAEKKEEEIINAIMGWFLLSKSDCAAHLDAMNLWIWKCVSVCVWLWGVPVLLKIKICFAVCSFKSDWDKSLLFSFLINPWFYPL